MPEFENMRDLDNFISNNIIDALGKLQDEIIKMLEQEYKTTWYDRTINTTHKSYIRTYQLTKGIESMPVKYSSGGGRNGLDDYSLDAEVAFTGKKIIPVDMSDVGLLSSYMDIKGNTDWNGKPITEWIGEWIEYGVKANPIYRIPRKYIFARVRNRLKSKDMQNKLKAILESKGFEFMER